MPEDLYDEDETQRDDMAAGGEDDGGGAADTMEDDMPPGAHAVHQMHDYYATGKDMMGDLSRGQENPAVKEKIQDCITKLDSELAELRDLFAQEYPEHEGPQGEELEAEEPEGLEEKDDLRDTPDKVNETAGRPAPETEGGSAGDRVEDEQRSRRGGTRKSTPIRRKSYARPGTSRKSMDPLDRAIERKRARLLALTTEDLD